jgi:hypothetical protein
MLEIINDFLGKFLSGGQYIELSPNGLGTSLLDHAIRCESVHFLSSSVLGWLVFCLTWTILSHSKSIWEDRFIFRVSLAWGLFASLSMHIIIDGFTKIA